MVDIFIHLLCQTSDRKRIPSALTSPDMDLLHGFCLFGLSWLICCFHLTHFRASCHPHMCEISISQLQKPQPKTSLGRKTPGNDIFFLSQLHRQDILYSRWARFIPHTCDWQHKSQTKRSHHNLNVTLQEPLKYWLRGQRIDKRKTNRRHSEPMTPNDWQKKRDSKRVLKLDLRAKLTRLTKLEVPAETRSVGWAWKRNQIETESQAELRWGELRSWALFLYFRRIRKRSSVGLFGVFGFFNLAWVFQSVFWQPIARMRLTKNTARS